MSWKIVLNNKEEFSVDNEEYKKIVPFLNKAKLFKLEDGTVINSAYIIQITEESDIKEYPVLPQEKRIGTPIIEEKKIKVPGGWQKPSIRKKMIDGFTQLKEAGYFKEFKDYFEWEKIKYREQ